MKKCKVCGEEKDELLDFRTQIDSKTGREYVDKTCRKCRSKKQKEYRANWKLEHRYGIDEVEREMILKSQDDKCKLCSRVFDGKIKINVDHDHKTKVVRGLLCTKCNILLQWFDDPILFKKAIDYTRTADARKALKELQK